MKFQRLTIILTVVFISVEVISMGWNYIVTSSVPFASGWGDHFNDRAIENGREFYNYFHNLGFTDASIFGMMGNIEHESYFNPGQMEIGYNGSIYYGHGLIQWTGDIHNHSYQSPILTYAQEYNRDWYGGAFQCFVINNIDSQGAWIPTQDYPILWDEYKELTNIETAVKCYYRNRERGGTGQEHYEIRIGYANRWKEIIGSQPEPSDDNELLIISKKHIKVRRELFIY